MSQVTLLFSNEVVLEDERVMKLDYSLIEKASEADPETSYYGVKVTKHLGNQIEMDEIPAISDSKGFVVSIIKKLCLFEVTPISMIEIVDGLFTEGM